MQILYTTTERIRAVLGTDDRTVSDTDLANFGLEEECEVEFSSWLPNHAEIAADTSDAAAVLKSTLVSVICKWYCAYLVGLTYKTRIPQEITNELGTKIKRWSLNDEDLQRFTDQYLKNKAKLTDIIAVEETGSLPGINILMTAVTSENDPVLTEDVTVDFS